MLNGIRPIANGLALTILSVTALPSFVLAAQLDPKLAKTEQQPSTSKTTHETYMGRWATELPGGARMVRFIWLRKTTRVLPNGQVETIVAPLRSVGTGLAAPARTGGGTIIIATQSSGGGGGGSSFGSGGGSSGGGGGGGGGSGGVSSGSDNSSDPSPEINLGNAPPKSNSTSQTTPDLASSGSVKTYAGPVTTSAHSSGSQIGTGVGTPITTLGSLGNAQQTSSRTDPQDPGSSTGTTTGDPNNATASTTPLTAPPIGNSVPVSIHVDGRNGPEVVVPTDLFNGQWSTNLTQTEIGGAGLKPRGRGLYPTGSLLDFDMAGYLDALDMAVRLHVPEGSTGFATLDYEDGLLPWAEKTRAIYKAGMSDEAYEQTVHRFFVESLRTAKAARPEVRWSFYGYPHSWENPDLTERISDIYAESDAVTPGFYIKTSGDPIAIEAHANRLGRSIAAIRARHPLGGKLPAAPYLWHRYSSIDKNKAFQPVSVEDFSAAISAAKPWADQFTMWMAASSPGEAALLSEWLNETGRIRELVYASRLAD